MNEETISLIYMRCSKFLQLVNDLSIIRDFIG